jgi:sodium/bile acid cotransporter 7
MIASALNLIAIPLMAWPLSLLLGENLGAGLIVTAAVPSTLASAAVWTRRAGGDDSVAIVVTIITNSVCFLVTPAWVYGLSGRVIPSELLTGTILKLFLFVVLPMFAGQLVRVHAGLGAWGTRHKNQLGIAAQIGVLSVVFLGAIHTGQGDQQAGTSTITLNLILLLCFLVIAIHVSALSVGLCLGRWLGLPRGQQIAIGFSGSQKTLMVGLSTAVSMGLNIFPMVAYHAMQLIVDTLIADRMRIRGNKQTSHE